MSRRLSILPKSMVHSTNVSLFASPLFSCGYWSVRLIVGVMSARGLLENPALYAGYETTPWGCIERFVNYSLEYSSNCHIFQHHLADMTGNVFTKKGIYP